jgi:hypothetical protein
VGGESSYLSREIGYWRKKERKKEKAKKLKMAKSFDKVEPEQDHQIKRSV